MLQCYVIVCVRVYPKQLSSFLRNAEKSLHDVTHYRPVFIVKAQSIIKINSFQVASWNFINVLLISLLTRYYQCSTVSIENNIFCATESSLLPIFNFHLNIIISPCLHLSARNDFFLLMFRLMFRTPFSSPQMSFRGPWFDFRQPISWKARNVDVYRSKIFSTS
jgi:hypothetical protein